MRVGRSAGVELRVVDGEIQVRGSTLMTAYHPAELHPNPPNRGGWLPTGDLGFIDTAGRLHVLGRDNVIVTGGEKVHPAEVEAVLERCPGVSACSVFGVDDETWDLRVAAAIVLEQAEPSRCRARRSRRTRACAVQTPTFGRLARRVAAHAVRQARSTASVKWPRSACALANERCPGSGV